MQPKFRLTAIETKSPKIESLQRRATKFILNNFNYDSDYRTRLIRCELLPLTLRRYYLDLTLFYSILQEESCINFEDYFSFQPANRTRDHFHINTTQHVYRMSAYKNFFFNRVHSTWNILPLEIRQLCEEEGLSNFKTTVTEFCFLQFLDKFDSTNKCTWFFKCSCNICKIYWH